MISLSSQNTTYLLCVNVASEMFQITSFLNKIGPPRSKVDVSESFIFQPTLEVGIHGKCKAIYKVCQLLLMQYRRAGHMHRISGGASSQPSGKLRPGWGHAGHSIASSPSRVAFAPNGSCPRPARFNIFRCRQMRITR